MPLSLERVQTQAFYLPTQLPSSSAACPKLNRREVRSLAAHGRGLFLCIHWRQLFHHSRRVLCNRFGRRRNVPWLSHKSPAPGTNSCRLFLVPCTRSARDTNAHPRQQLV